jgi:small subunit ribosomal protein S17
MNIENVVSNETKKKKKILTGTVISKKMEKTITVEIERVFTHKLVKKIVRSKRVFQVHDENNIAKAGDTVEIFEGRPVSKTKYMYLLKIIK